MFGCFTVVPAVSPHATLKVLWGKKSADRHLWHVDTRFFHPCGSRLCVGEPKPTEYRKSEGNLKWGASAAGREKCFPQASFGRVYNKKTKQSRASLTVSRLWWQWSERELVKAQGYIFFENELANFFWMFDLVSSKALNLKATFFFFCFKGVIKCQVNVVFPFGLWSCKVTNVLFILCLCQISQNKCL